MNNTLKNERKLLLFTYLLCMVCSLNLYFLKSPFDQGAIVIGVVICILIGYSHFIIRHFFPAGDKYILIFSCILSSIGIFMLYRINRATAVKQLIWFISGIAVFILIIVILPDIEKFSKFRYFYLIMTLACMAAGSLLGKEQYGSKNWITIGSNFSFQPSEFGKLFLVAYLASSLKYYKSFKNLIEPAFVVMASLGFMVLQKDLGSALIIFAISVTMLYISTSKVKYVAVCIGLFAVGSYISYKMFAHVRVRIMIWQNPWKYAHDQGLQLVQSMFSIASGGLFGSGLGLGHPEFVPVNTSDFIFASICEEFGLLVGFGIIILYFLLFYRCMRAAIFVDEGFSRILSVGFSAMIGSQALVIIGGVVNMIPLTGVTLPLVSYGGTSMFITYVALGLIQKTSEEGNRI